MTDKSENEGVESPFRTIKEAAKILRVHHRTLDNWRWAGKGPKYRKHGKRVVYHIKDLDDYSGGEIIGNAGS